MDNEILRHRKIFPREHFPYMVCPCAEDDFGPEIEDQPDLDACSTLYDDMEFEEAMKKDFEVSCACCDRVWKFTHQNTWELLAEDKSLPALSQPQAPDKVEPAPAPAPLQKKTVIRGRICPECDKVESLCECGQKAGCKGWSSEGCGSGRDCPEFEEDDHPERCFECEELPEDCVCDDNACDLCGAELDVTGGCLNCDEDEDDDTFEDEDDDDDCEEY